MPLPGVGGGEEGQAALLPLRQRPLREAAPGNHSPEQMAPVAA